MPILKKHILFFATLLSFTGLLGQNKSIDSLYKILSLKIHDSTRVNVYNQLCWPIYSFSNTDSSIKYGNRAVNLTIKNHDTVKLIVAYRRLGIAYINKGDQTMALECQQHSYDLAKKIHSKKAMASALNNLSVIYLNISDYRKAIDYSIQSQKLQEELKDSTNLFNSYYNTGLMFIGTSDFPKAKLYYNKAFIVAKTQNKIGQKGFAYSGLARICKKENKIDSAYYYYFKAEDCFKKEEHLRGLEESYINVGNLFIEDKRVKNNSNLLKGLSYFRMALTINKKYTNKISEANIFGNIAYTYNLLQETDSALYYGLKALNLAKEVSGNSEILYSAEILTEAYYKKGDFPLAFKYLNLQLSIKDSVFSFEKQKDIGQKQLQFEFEKKSIADSLRVSEEKKITREKLKQEATIRYSLVFFVLLLIIFSFFMYNRFNIIKSQKHIIEDQKNKVDVKQKEILDSIHYAKRIQTALLANQELIDANVSENFILFRPKDIVSGDFYWAAEHDNKFYLAVCDCTGHGVPGAFMSLLNVGFLNEAVKEKHLEKPNEIFNYVRTRLLNSISKEGQQDGMDGLLICLDKTTKQLTYAAANNEPILISNNQPLELPKDKMPVGKGEKNESFKLYSIDAKVGDTIYLYTDGFADQFGGPKGKKFKYKQLNELLLSNVNEPMERQKELLDTTIESWKGNLEQVDDVLVIGIKI